MSDVQIKYFIEIVNNDCNFTKTSQELYVSQSALSYHIITLGKELGVKLFDTTNKLAPKLTPGGKLLYDYFVESKGWLREKIAEAQRLNEITSGELKIASSIGWDMNDVLQALEDFRLRHPSIDAQFCGVSFKTIETGLKNNYYDIIITSQLDFKNKAEYNFETLYEVPAVLLYSAKHKFANKAKIKFSDFKHEIFYEPSKDEKLLDRIIHEEYCKDNGFIPKVKELPNMESIFLLVDAGAGCAIIDKRMRICKNLSYKWIELDYTINIGFVWKKKNTNPAVKLFLDDVIATVGAHAPPQQPPDAPSNRASKYSSG